MIYIIRNTMDSLVYKSRHVSIIKIDESKIEYYVVNFIYNLVKLQEYNNSYNKASHTG